MHLNHERGNWHLQVESDVDVSLNKKKLKRFSLSFFKCNYGIFQKKKIRISTDKQMNTLIDEYTLCVCIHECVFLVPVTTLTMMIT